MRPDEVWIAHSEVCGLRHKWDFGAGNPCDNIANSKKVKGCEAHRNRNSCTSAGARRTAAGAAAQGAEAAWGKQQQ